MIGLEMGMIMVAVVMGIRLAMAWNWQARGTQTRWH